MSWRYSVGQKSVNRVTVYERPDGASIYIEWWDDEGRHREVLRSSIGHPIVDREFAMEIAQKASEAQLRKRRQSAAQMLGLQRGEHTLEDLLNRLHADKSSEWTPKYAKSRELRKRWWLENLGSPVLERVTPAQVERLVREEREERGLSNRWAEDVLLYLVHAYDYARDKLKWIDARHDLRGVTLPKKKKKPRKPYTLEEAQKLLPALWEVDPVAGWMGEVALATGRRPNAIRQLRQEDVLVDGEFAILRFPADTDKVGVVGEALVHKLRQRTDWTVPSQETMIGWIHEAEELAGIKHIDGRAWYGLKRLYATLTQGMPAADLQAGVLEGTLKGIYRHDDRTPKRELAVTLAGTVRGD